MATIDSKSLGRVGVLYGGTSSEREISLQSGNAVLAALQSVGADVIGIDIQDNAAAIEQIRQASIDIAFIALHGGAGEDGRIQALLDFMGIPFTGSGVQSCALSMNKLFSKQLWQGIGVPTSAFCVLESDTPWQSCLDQLGGAVMVKPAHEGSSIGMTIAKSAAELEKAYHNAAQYDSSVFAERLLEGPEYTIAVLNGRALPPIRLETGNQFYDYDAKYLSNETRYVCPCGLAAEAEDKIKQLALQAFTSLQCSGWGRVDIMCDADGNFSVLEVNTVPGMTSHSLVPMAAKAVGLSFADLVVDILAAVNPGAN